MCTVSEQCDRQFDKFTLQHADRLDIILRVLTRMVYLHYISCLRYTVLVGNPIGSANFPHLSAYAF